MSRKQQLIDRFAKSEDRQVDYSTNLPEDEHAAQYSGREFNGVSVLPNGKEMFYCHHCADWVIEVLGTGMRAGFFVEDNPVEDMAIVDAEGHNFAVIDGRFIVDVWLQHFTETSKQGVFDMHDPADHAAITHHFGDPSKWDLYDPSTKVLLKAEFVPESLRPTIQIAPEFAAEKPSPKGAEDNSPSFG
ncbi:hypothetical protein HNP46_006081 [Pseudomonas nitritireducens]|uniref:Uncharacterized protein n=1 Tax=Pseudomonas nitroreducens TaxID=46680 RepID=A0A7W7P4Z0_PSENT|nr:hypothetical protein [Pseudomonas nitritireducens]MBB4867170.1 hypothetical protein [Pseudomonas nitritireducens]